MHLGHGRTFSEGEVLKNMDHRNRRWLHSRSWASGQRPDGGWLICFGRRDAPIGAKTVLSIRWNSSRIIISIKLLLNSLVQMSTSATCGWQREGVHVEWRTLLNGNDWGRKPNHDWGGLYFELRFAAPWSATQSFDFSLIRHCRHWRISHALLHAN